ncbi:MAG: addiction module protein [Flavobacteriales bacterium]|nr:addiction module protein [Flavobacteriales bacterium]
MKITLDIQESRFKTFLEFIKTLDYVSVPNEDIPQWQMDEVERRIQDLKQYPEKAIDFDLTINDVEAKYGL